MNNITGESALLKIEQVSVYYGVIQALRSVSLEIRHGELVCLIGANGAGKSTLLKSIMGLLNPTHGNIFFKQTDITHRKTHQHAEQGLVLVPEGRGIFSTLTVLENLQMGAYHRSDKNAIQQDLHHVYTLLPRLAERRQQLAGTLSGGEQQMLAIGRALLARPRLLLLDEPSMGLAPLLAEKIFELINAIHREGVSILLVEQNAHASLGLADRAYVMEHGEIILHGEAQALLNNPKVQSAYLGL
jgi:branched-chain amino acid transport system ATP-binding protein